MNIKKFLLLSVIAIVAAMSANGAELSREALNLRSQIKSYLSQEGYVPTIDEDGDIRFKYQGDTYFIQIFDVIDDIALRYLVVVNVPDQVSSAKAIDVCTQITQKKLCARAVLSRTGKSIGIQVDTFCSGFQMFKDTFYDNMHLVDGISDNAIELLK